MQFKKIIIIIFFYFLLAGTFRRLREEWEEGERGGGEQTNAHVQTFVRVQMREFYQLENGVHKFFLNPSPSTKQQTKLK